MRIPGSEPTNSVAGPVSASRTEESTARPTPTGSRLGGIFAASSTSQAEAKRSNAPNPVPLQYRQILESNSSASATTSNASGSIETSSSVTLNRTLFSQATSVPPVVEPIYRIGSYSCSPSTNLDMVVNLMRDYLSQTDYALNAAVKYLVFNIHAARSADVPNEPTLAPDQADMPYGADLLGAIFSSELSSYMYTPRILDDQRANLNTSWQSPDISAMARPISVYYTNNTLPDDILTSTDGWPSESFMEFANERRLILAHGTIDPQMDAYDVDSDNGLVFTYGTADEYIGIASSSNQAVTRGCFFDPNDDSLAAGNSSWALAVQTTGLSDLGQRNGTTATSSGEVTNNITSCGISPVLNDTLLNDTADVNVQPYKQFAYNSFWSWAPEQPKQYSNESSADLFNSDDQNMSGKDFRCAMFNASMGGRWEATFCQNRLPAACRARNSPYAWQVPPARSTYGLARDSCPEGHIFAVPRNALENRHLLAMVQQARARDEKASQSVWIDFNSLDAESCWVVGINSTCPYSKPENQNRGEIVVPIVAGFIIIFVALATVLVKCGSNRSKSKRRRKVRDGWDYEGVPS